MFLLSKQLFTVIATLLKPCLNAYQALLKDSRHVFLVILHFIVYELDSVAADYTAAIFTVIVLICLFYLHCKKWSVSLSGTLFCKKCAYCNIFSVSDTLWMCVAHFIFYSVGIFRPFKGLANGILYTLYVCNLGCLAILFLYYFPKRPKVYIVVFNCLVYWGLLQFPVITFISMYYVGLWTA